MKKARRESKRQTPLFAYRTAREFVPAYKRQDENKYRHDTFYFRGGSSRLADLENAVAKLTGVDKGHLALTTSGMSAFITALDTAALTRGDVVIHGTVEYGQIYNYLNIDLRERGVIPIEVNVGDSSALASVLKQTVARYSKERIKVIFLETVGNGPDMPVLDIERFLSLPILRKIDPLILVDNTLPTSSIISLAPYLKRSPLKVVALESATKFYLFNQDLGGILFTYRDDLLQKLLTKRKRSGATPGPSLIERFEQLLPRTKTQFDRRNTLTMQNTKFLAEACNETQGSDNVFTVGYPTLPQHDNRTYVQKKYRDGIAPVFFISTLKNSFCTTEELFYALEEEGAFKGTFIAESFGFERTSVSYSPRCGGYIRVAGGLESVKGIGKIAKQLQRTLSAVYERPAGAARRK
ncbi:hypothetical protein A2851_05370 [Candidatus Kaiserbacteria bacterium RIFCSPHIGHO2_01_FULL_53_29]|uniref:Cystathionine gamma-synthase n=1 Tax=Candidatus Kaiserbacteria bacterium RIFCSPHIGHO2_01_FULL_53_29 TaxID=1798480 RepID=A0A1F6CU77_9BACT|nr:MAG: hypothetical protein A2851_05370 [Candidatus Kaiserbacteria bacterium RIFCSPHIGHO2_01_FULL_53_29]